MTLSIKFYAGIGDNWHIEVNESQRRQAEAIVALLPKHCEAVLVNESIFDDPIQTAHQAGVEATLRARIATLERETARWASDVRSINAAKAAKEAELIRLRYDRNTFNVRDQRMCERIQKAEGRIRELEAEGVPSLIGQLNAWRDIAARLHDILKNKDPS